MVASPPIQCLVTLDVEGVLTPEVWIALAENLKIDALRRTTKDEPDYQLLMDGRLRILREQNVGMEQIRNVIDTLSPLDGAHDFLQCLQSRFPVILLSDTFEDFIEPLMEKLGQPTILCHKLNISEDGEVMDFHPRITDQKKHAVQAFRKLNYRVIAAGDSYNDLSMIDAADAGFLFRAPDNVRTERSDLVAIDAYDELFNLICQTEQGFK
ncbi:MAG: bifunctional phosphoserine phosphatase/homoserine phosphotransferase ThrH [Acidimicrobiales bacterium]|nr:bifunctional phosphoserine phosphatase/homoserine phosphotransferase ThrH [Acidimicrobiales bacterium]MDG1846140.1 bifunctional phosphoserine phosphatase/homoserine phosphotransferase ThrH [Acidimicrobiales bacterium]